MPRFVVERTSQHGEAHEPPCPEAFRGTIQEWDRRTSESPEAFDRDVAAKFRDTLPWLEEGTEHGYWEAHDGSRGIKRRRPDATVWFVELSTLAELLTFGEKYGDLILTLAEEDGESLCIEIYDEYRE